MYRATRFPNSSGSFGSPVSLRSWLRTGKMITRNGTISDFCLKLNDLSLLVLSLGIVIVFRYSPSSSPTFVVDYLSQRVKVTNAMLGLVLLLSWYAAFAAQGLYTSHRLGSRTKEL